MRKVNVRIIVLTLFTLVAWSSLMIGGCGGGDSGDTNPFVWPKLEGQNGMKISNGLDHPIAILLDKKGGSGSTWYWYICNQGSTPGTGYISRVPYGDTDATGTAWVVGLDNPRGMGLTQDNHRLVVALATSVVVINTVDGSILRTINITDATNLGGVTVRSQDGMYYTADSTNKQIFRGEYNTNNSWENFRGDSVLTNVDALLLISDQEYLLAGTVDKIYSMEIDGATEPEEFISVPDNYDVNGLARIYGTMYLISSRNTHEIYAVDTLSHRQWLSTINTGTPGYIYVHVDGDENYYLYVPTIENNEVLVFKVTPDYDNSPVW